MKYIITGFHASGKREVINDLKNEVKVGKTFNNLEEEIPQMYHTNDKYYSNEDVNTMFENHAYIFIREITEYNKPYYTGLSLYDYEQNDVFVLSPEQMNSIPFFPGEVCIIWMDNSTSERRQRYNSEHRKYDFNLREELEKQDSTEYITKLYKLQNSHLIYFENEEPLRVSAIVQTLVKHPELVPLFESHYN